MRDPRSPVVSPPAFDDLRSSAPAPRTSPLIPEPSSSTTTSTVPSPAQDSLVCHSDHCEYMSEKLRATTNVSINPCDDFYQYVCGTINDSDYFPFRLVGDLKQWMISLNLDLATQTPTEPYNSVDLMVRCSLQYGLSPIFQFQISKLVFVTGKRNLQFTLSKNDERWLELRKQKRKDAGERAEQELYLSYLILYTSDREELRTMFSNTFALDDQVTLQMTRFVSAEDKLVQYQLRGLAHFTTPVAESDQWDLMVAKYTDGVYNGSDQIVFNESTSLILQNVLNNVRSEGLRYLVAWSVFRQGVETALQADW
ncbi:hypothetical protein HPB52_014535 [Rhipicephalus sanguineus]|uniref:Peptidase M13 N-terminal domain-containing protein n=1 Tax=Rhipicephalus sanguineus TaxID=34632 RepID=A0A9D4PWK1_RHISA|nr:hypothetical protein HPB52_014535 [Rhipicephalus sanguineus]